MTPTHPEAVRMKPKSETIRPSKPVPQVRMPKPDTAGDVHECSDRVVAAFGRFIATAAVVALGVVMTGYVFDACTDVARVECSDALTQRTSELQDDVRHLRQEIADLKQRQAREFEWLSRRAGRTEDALHGLDRRSHDVRR